MAPDARERPAARERCFPEAAPGDPAPPGRTSIFPFETRSVLLTVPASTHLNPCAARKSSNTPSVAEACATGEGCAGAESLRTRAPAGSTRPGATPRFSGDVEMNFMKGIFLHVFFTQYTPKEPCNLA